MTPCRTTRESSRSEHRSWKRLFFVFALITFIVFPAGAADEGFPQIEIGIGYGGVKLSSISGFTSKSCFLDPFCGGGFIETSSGNHSGFVSQQSFNANRWFGIENYLGYYGAGEGLTSKAVLGRNLSSTLFTDACGAKAAVRKLKWIVPYGAAGIGVSAVSAQGQGSESGVALRLASGLDIPFNDTVGIRLDYSRFSSHLFNQWQISRHLSVELVFTLRN